MRRNILIFSTLIALSFVYGCASDKVEPDNATPANLVFTPNSINVLVGEVGTSTTPSIDGAQPITFELVSSPSSEITIDGSTGVISSTATLAEGSYSISVKAINAGGEATFQAVFTIQVSNANSKPSGLTYSESSLTIRKHEAKSTTASAQGTPPLTYAFVNPSSLPSGITINTSTGKIDFAENITYGMYNISVTVSNSIGAETFTDIVSLESKKVVYNGVSGVKEIMSGAGCEGCHTGSYDNYSGTKSGANGIKNRTSLPASNGSSMPRNQSNLPQEQIDRISQWIIDGLDEN
ncbi:MAG: hypothetical protein ACI85I_002121 [Arenicella sp.]|jgi:hypothetical protein